MSDGIYPLYSPSIPSLMYILAPAFIKFEYESCNALLSLNGPYYTLIPVKNKGWAKNVEIKKHSGE
jgi:hypothetical protein